MIRGPVPLDEFALHQTSLSLAYVGTSDRNFYDRWYFNAHDRSGEIFVVMGMGFYPNLGTTDAFIVVKRGSMQKVLRASSALDDFGPGRMRPSVGPITLEVIEPLQRIRLTCDHDELSMNMTWQGSFPAVEEQHHLMRQGPRAILDASRFAQVGTWSGSLAIGGEEIRLSPESWVGTRDRSWGIRPVGEPEPAGRDLGISGFWWLYIPLRFDDCAVIVIAQEDVKGFRTLNDATRIYADGEIEQLGWPRVSIDYRKGTRYPLSAEVELTAVDGSPLTLGIETLGSVALNIGTGYGGDPEWGHGRWSGVDFCEVADYDLEDPALVGRATFGVVDHVARAILRDAHGREQEGWGMFEHASIGRHDPSGFADLSSVQG